MKEKSSKDNAVQQQYTRPQLFEQIVQRLEEQGIDLKQVKRADIEGVDEFHVRGAAVSRELAEEISLRHLKVLDVGCGLGGPCRMLADEFDCEVTGIDLNAEFVRTATQLSTLTGLSDHTTFVQGDATQLPFSTGSFDLVWTQHVQMNVAEKKQFYGEINRVLRPGGYFIYYDIFKNDEGAIEFPVPWADYPEISFLITKENVTLLLESLGLKKEKTQDETQAGIEFFESVLTRIRQYGPPKLGLNVLMGMSTQLKIRNLLNGLLNEQLVLESGIYRK